MGCEREMIRMLRLAIRCVMVMMRIAVILCAMLAAIFHTRYSSSPYCSDSSEDCDGSPPGIEAIGPAAASWKIYTKDSTRPLLTVECMSENMLARLDVKIQISVRRRSKH